MSVLVTVEAIVRVQMQVISDSAEGACRDVARCLGANASTATRPRGEVIAVLSTCAVSSVHAGGE